MTPLLALPYLYLSETYGRWPEDEDELLAAWAGYTALANRPRPGPGFWAAQRAFLVKFFFLPLMTVFLVGNAWAFEEGVRMALRHRVRGHVLWTRLPARRRSCCWPVR